MGKAELKDGVISLNVVGKSAHGSTPQFGENAIDRMMSFFIEVGMKGSMLDAYQILLLNDFLGKKLGVSYTDEEMGELTNNVGVLQSKNGTYQIHLNLRYPNHVDFDQVVLKLKQALHKLIQKIKHQTFKNIAELKTLNGSFNTRRKRTNIRRADKLPKTIIFFPR